MTICNQHVIAYLAFHSQQFNKQLMGERNLIASRSWKKLILPVENAVVVEIVMQAVGTCAVQHDVTPKIPKFI